MPQALPVEMIDTIPTRTPIELIETIVMPEARAGGAGGGKSSRRMHLDYVDGLRALAALYVVLHHCWYNVFTPEQRGWPSDGVWRITGWLFYGHFSVSAFIVISGFSLMLPIVHGDGRLAGGFWRFIKRRARRILVPYYFAMGFALVLIWQLIGQKTGTHWDLSIPVTPESILTHVLLIHDFDVASVYKINGVFWSIAVEWQIYFLFPALVLLTRKLGAAIATALTVALAYITFFGLLQTPVGRLPIYGNTGIMPQYVALFALGMLGATIAFSPQHTWSIIRRVVPWKSLALVSVCGVGIWCHLTGERYFSPWQLGTLDLLVGICTLAVLVVGANPGRNAVRTVLGWKPLASVGTFSFSLYLIHAPLVQVIRYYVITPLRLGDLASLGALLLVGVPLIVGAAYVFFLVCERPFMNTRPSKRMT